MAANAAYWVVAAAVGATAVESEEANKRANKAEDIQEERADVEKAIQQEAASRSRRSEVRKGLRARGDIENLAEQTGGTGGTAATQSVASVATTSAANVGQINSTVAGKNAVSDLQTDLFKTQQPTDLERGAGLVKTGASLFV